MEFNNLSQHTVYKKCFYYKTSMLRAQEKTMRVCTEKEIGVQLLCTAINSPYAKTKYLFLFSSHSTRFRVIFRPAFHSGSITEEELSVLREG